jgi:shikimate dehydrogenase
MKRFCVIGHPFKKSYTTAVLNAICKELKVDAEFETKEIAPEHLEDFMKELRTEAYQGAIVASPHKTPSIDAMDEVTGSVEGAKALNLIVDKNGKLHGHNVNGYGAMHAVQSAFGDLRHVRILIVGAGGAARAAAYRLDKVGAKVSIWNRTTEKAKACAEHLGIEFVEDMREWNGKPQIIINATNVSSQEKQSTLIPFPLWEECTLALDSVYGGTSLFLEEAQAMGVKASLGGDYWFAHQAVEALDRLLELEVHYQLPLEMIGEVEAC